MNTLSHARTKLPQISLKNFGILLVMVSAMKLLRDLSHLDEITPVECRELISNRIWQICPDGVYVPADHSQFYLMEPGDQISEIEAGMGCRIVTSYFDNTQYGDAEFSPCWEILADYPGCYEMVFILTDGDYSDVIIIPKMAGIDARLLQLCGEYSESLLDLIPLETISKAGNS